MARTTLMDLQNVIDKRDESIAGLKREVKQKERWYTALEYENKRLAAEASVARARAMVAQGELREYKTKESPHAHLQRKVAAQSAEIRRLNAKLNELGA